MQGIVMCARVGGGRIYVYVGDGRVYVCVCGRGGGVFKEESL